MTASTRALVEWVSVRRAGTLLGCAPQTIYRLMKDGVLVGNDLYTEAGHKRTIVMKASVDAELARRAAAAPTDAAA